jgi:translation initiation factor 3 subunit C
MLAERFEMPEREVHSIVSKMMLDAEVHASHDQPTNTIVVQRTEPSKLQFLALQFSDKCSQLVEMNERVLDVRTGSYGYKERGFQSEGGYRRPWVERGDREGHRGGFRPWEHRGGGGRGRGDRDRIEGQGRRF